MSENLKNSIRKLESKNRLIAGQLVDAIWIVDADTLVFDYITTSIEKISGYKADAYIGNSIKDRLTDLSFKELTPLLSREKLEVMHRQGEAKTFEVELAHKKKTTYWAEIRAKLVRDEDGKIKIVGITRNITRQKNAEKEKQKLIDKLEQTIKEKNNLLKEIETLQGLLPICSCCKRIRDDKGKWWPLDLYVKKHTQADLTHTICLDCKDIFYGAAAS